MNEEAVSSRSPTEDAEASEGSDAYEEEVSRSEFVDEFQCDLNTKFSPSASQVRSNTPGSALPPASASSSANVTPSAFSFDPAHLHTTQGTPTSARQRATLLKSRRGSGMNTSAMDLGEAMGSVDLSSGPVDIYGERKSLMLLDDVMVTCQDDGEADDDIVSADNSEGSFEEAVAAYGRARRNHKATNSEGGLIVDADGNITTIAKSKAVSGPPTLTRPATAGAQPDASLSASPSASDSASPSPMHRRTLPASLLNSQSAPNSPAPATRKNKSNSASGNGARRGGDDDDDDLDIAVVCDGEESPADGPRAMRYDNQSMVSDFTLFSERDGANKDEAQKYGRGGKKKRSEKVPRPKKVVGEADDGREERCCSDCVVM